MSAVIILLSGFALVFVVGITASIVKRATESKVCDYTNDFYEDARDEDVEISRAPTYFDPRRMK